MLRLTTILCVMLTALFAHGAELQPGQALMHIVAIRQSEHTTWIHWQIRKLEPGPATPRMLEPDAVYRVRTDEPDAFSTGQDLVATPTHGLAQGPHGEVSYLQWDNLHHADGQPIKQTRGEGHILSLQGPPDTVEAPCPPKCTRGE